MEGVGDLRLTFDADAAGAIRTISGGNDVLPAVSAQPRSYADTLGRRTV